MASQPPKGTRHRQKIRNHTQPPPKDLPPRRGQLKPEELVDLKELIKDQFGFEPQQFQMDAIIAQLQGRDVLVHAGTGKGKTMIGAGPHVHASSKGKVSIVVSPLIALHNEQVETFNNELKLKAVAVNSQHGGCNQQVLEKIVAGEWQVVIISPEMLLSRRFIREVLKNPEFGRRVLSVMIDEAHVVSHWGTEFRKKYGTLGIIRAFLPRGTPIVAVSATLPARVRQDVLSKLQFGKDYVNIDEGNDRPNVSIVVRAIHEQMQTYGDLDFVVDGDGVPVKAVDIKKAFIYADRVSAGTEIEDHLEDVLPPHLRGTGIIRPYNAAHGHAYLKRVMKLFRGGVVRVLVCTDAAGMGCNIPDIDVVVQWKLPSSLSSFVQRAGRAARGKGRVGLAVLLAEQSAFQVDLDDMGKVQETTTSAKSSKGERKKGKGRTHKQKKAKGKGGKKHGEARGSRRGARDGLHDAIFVREQPRIDPEGLDEGLYALVQTGRCRRNVITQVYNNKPTSPTAPCCDICDPTLLKRTRPGVVVSARRKNGPKRGIPCEDVRDRLVDWRSQMWERDYEGALFSSAALLRDETVDLLASVGPFTSRGQLERLLGGQWKWERKYGGDLYDLLANLDIPPMKPIPRKPRGSKRAVEGGIEGERATRRVRTSETEGPMTAAGAVTSSSSEFQLTSYTHSLDKSVGREYEYTM